MLQRAGFKLVPSYLEVHHSNDISHPNRASETQREKEGLCGRYGYRKALWLVAFTKSRPRTFRALMNTLLPLHSHKLPRALQTRSGTHPESHPVVCYLMLVLFLT